MAATALAPAKRNQILRVIFISLLLDLVQTSVRLRGSNAKGWLDIFHLHPTAVPQASRVLSKPRSPLRIIDFYPQSHTAWSECLQTLLLTAYQR